jgi:hypothetical protein
MDSYMERIVSPPAALQRDSRGKPRFNAVRERVWPNTYLDLPNLLSAASTTTAGLRK